MEQPQHEHIGVGGKQVDIFKSTAANCPVIYLNTFPDVGEKVQLELERLKSPDHTLVAISGLQWDHDMAPWDIPPISRDDTPCTGGAKDYLQLLVQEILPKAEEALAGTPAWRALTGYSLAGLFAVYAIYQTTLFSRIASMSGSLWFPGFKEYVMSHEMKRKPEHLYFSLGDLESKTRNPYLKAVRDNTQVLAAYYQSQQIDTAFQLHQGDHYTESVKRTALGIRWLLTRA